METKYFKKEPVINFEDTETGFSYKSNSDLLKAKFLFSIMKQNWIVKIGTVITPLALKWKLPVRGLIKNTIFKQFVGGETLSATTEALTVLEQFKVKAILDYGAEGKDDEASFNKTCNEFIRLINYAAQNNNVPFISIKITGLARFELLEKLNTKVKRENLGLVIHTDHLTIAENEEWAGVVERIETICRKGAENKIGILIDAEESWIQDTIDSIADAMMEKYNSGKAVVYNTIQFYRTGRLHFLKDSFTIAEHKGYILGVKIVRGAYMEKERARALSLNYPSPIQPDKNATDESFNKGVVFCIKKSLNIAVVIATHNDYSNLLAIETISIDKMAKEHSSVHFSQLYGMSDNITFNLASAGFSVSKYVPYGPIDDVVPYLMRRAQENTSVSGQTGRELFLINKEIKRRLI